MAARHLWFKPRTAGLQWGSPATKQGWAVYAVFVVVWLVALVAIVPRDIRDTTTGLEIGVASIIFLLDIVVLGYFLAKHGDVPSLGSVKKRLTRRG